MIVERYFEDCHCLHLNTLSPRAYFIPCEDTDSALSENPRVSTKRLQLLNGVWDFKYYSSIHEVKEEFWNIDYSRRALIQFRYPRYGRCRGTTGTSIQT